MKRVYLIRHGLPDFPSGVRMCIGTTDIPMSETGFAQAKAMAAKLPPVTAVFSSPLTRAIQTAEAIGMPITVVDGFREMYAGEWDGLTFEEIRRRYPDLYEARGQDPTLPLPGAEDHEAGLARFAAAMEQAVCASSGDFAVVAHGGVIAQFMKKNAGRWYKPAYTEIIPLIWESGNYYLQEEC